MKLTVKDLSPDQREAYQSIMKWIDKCRGEEKPLITLGGFAGSGKSTLVGLVSSGLDLVAYVAFTGKAASVLRRKLKDAGTDTIGATRRDPNGQMSLDPRPYCGTIHGLVYRPCECREPQTVELKKPCPEKDCVGETDWIVQVHGEPGESRCTKGHKGLVKSRAAFEKLTPRKKFIYAERDENGKCKKCGGKEWMRRESLDRAYSLIIVDEASMVDDTMLRDLQSFGVPILAVGDHGQLPPVGGAGSLMKNPNLRLERIHRQAEGNPIIALSKMIRETGRLPNRMPGGAVRFEELRFVERIIEERYAEASAKRLLEMGLAAYTNRRRCGLNLMVRRQRGVARKGLELPKNGEHVICLRNMREKDGRPPVSNGMRGVLRTDALPKQNRNHAGKKIGESETQLVGSVEFVEDGIQPTEYEMLRAQFGREKTFSSPEELAKETGLHSFSMAGALFDFGYAMTVHKMQGSQFDDLLVCAERPGMVGEEDWRRWLYTAVTRAASKLTVLR